MTAQNLVTVPEGTTLDQAKEILHKHRIEKLLVVDRRGRLAGMITVKDIMKQIEHPNACKDDQGRLRVGAAAEPVMGVPQRGLLAGIPQLPQRRRG